jgi:hypothetical protein
MEYCRIPSGRQLPMTSCDDGDLESWKCIELVQPANEMSSGIKATERKFKNETPMEV